MRVIHFSCDEERYLAIQRHGHDPDRKIPVYKKESDGVYRVTPICFPACTKFMHGFHATFDQEMTAQGLHDQFGEVSLLRPGHGLEHVHVSRLDKKQKEAYFYQQVSALLAGYGYACHWLIADWQGADFIAVHVDGSVLNIQLKSGGYEINRKYCAYKDLWMLFQQQDHWYLIKHCELVKIADETTNQLNTQAWKGKPHKFNIARARPLPRRLEEALKEYKLIGNTLN